MSVILFLIIDLFIGKKKDSMTLSCQLLNQLSIIDSNIIKLIIWGGIILFFYASILILIDGYHTMWNDLILYPRDKKNKQPTPRQPNSGRNKADYKLNGCQDPLGGYGIDTVKLAVAKGMDAASSIGTVQAMVDADGFVTAKWA